MLKILFVAVVLPLLLGACRTSSYREVGWEYRTFKVDRSRLDGVEFVDSSGGVVMGDPALYGEQYRELLRQGWTLVRGPYGNVWEVFPMRRPVRPSRSREP
jgi:hypothetical protein